MRAFTENLFAVAVVIGTEAWFLAGYFSGKPDFEPAIALVAAVGVLLAKGPIRAHFSPPGISPTHDQALFAEFLKVLPYDPAIRFVRDQDFADSVQRAPLQSLFDFAHVWDSVEREFLDKELESARKALLGAVMKFVQEIAGRTVPLRSGDFISVYPDAQRMEGRARPPDVIEDGKVLNALADALVPQYEGFVRFAKGKLAR